MQLDLLTDHDLGAWARCCHTRGLVLVQQYRAALALSTSLP